MRGYEKYLLSRHFNPAKLETSQEDDNDPTLGDFIRVAGVILFLAVGIALIVVILVLSFVEAFARI